LASAIALNPEIPDPWKIGRFGGGCSIVGSSRIARLPAGQPTVKTEA
jgi:hypothetical protein